MTKVDFDEHAGTYRETLNACFAPFGGKDTFFDSYKIDCIKQWVAADNQAYDILDYGCGIGKITGPLAKEFQQSTVHGWDISRESLRVAREENRELKNIHFIDELSPEQKYNFIIVVMVFHHIKPDERVSVLLEMKKLLKPGGKIVIFEHNPLNPVTRYIVSACPFDADAELILRNKFVALAKLSGFEVEFKRHILFFPWPAKLFRNIERLLRFIPLGAQYMLILAPK
ncbi:MAG: class I SAM-dependent methyltransferase [bacterium]|nr:class I SAM-dependent methyltransferase [bacterium]